MNEYHRIEEIFRVQFHHMLMDFRDQVTSDACNNNKMLLILQMLLLRYSMKDSEHYWTLWPS